MSTLTEIFSRKLTENGDVAYNTTGNKLLDILFMSSYFQEHLNEVKIGNSDKEKLFSMFIRDPRNGLGLRDLGRVLMKLSEVSDTNIVKAGRYDDLFYGVEMLSDDEFNKLSAFLYNEVISGNELAKKWMPRYSSKNLMLARKFAKSWGLNKQQYGHLIKCDTTENKLSRKNVDAIEFEHVPSQAMLKYYKRFLNGEDTHERFKQYIKDVASGKKDMKVSTTTVYDIYKNRTTIDADLFFSKIEKISGNWIPIVDTSGSMANQYDAMGKAMSIGHYLAKCSTYAPDKVISFSSYPQLLTLGSENNLSDRHYFSSTTFTNKNAKSTYEKEINSMYTGDCSNTDFGAVMELLKGLTELPEYLVVLSDMEFDYGSKQSREELELLWKENGYTTKIVWWNFNERNRTVPEVDKNGNIYISGYNPMLLQYLECGFNGEQFLDKLLSEYANKIV